MSTRAERIFGAIVRRVGAGGSIDEVPASRLAKLRPAPSAAVAEAEELAGWPLPVLLRRLYLEVGTVASAPVMDFLGLTVPGVPGSAAAVRYAVASGRAGAL